MSKLNGSSRREAVPNRVAIVGLGPSSLCYVQDVDRAGNRKSLYDETWTFNSYCNVIESDRLFHMDDVKVQEIRAAAGNQRVANMLKAMQEYKNPIYTCFPEPEYPTAVAYPLAEVAGKYNSLYFTTTPPYALAYAGYIGVNEVMLYGCHYTWPGVAGAESGRACMEFWVGLMRGLGMTINIHPQSSLLDSRVSTREAVKLYGYDRCTVSLREIENQTAIVLTEKPLPSAAEIEDRYSHRKAGSDVQLDVVN